MSLGVSITLTHLHLIANKGISIKKPDKITIKFILIYKTIKTKTYVKSIEPAYK